MHAEDRCRRAGPSEGSEREDDPEAPKPVLDFEIGEEVRLTEGRYASMRGRIDEINDTRGKLTIENLSLLPDDVEHRLDDVDDMDLR